MRKEFEKGFLLKRKEEGRERERMKVAPTIVFLLRDPDGFGAAIADALHPNPNPNSRLRRLEESFELSLERYGIKDCKACGDLVHFVDDKYNLQVSLILLNNYEPPILACAVNEVLAQIIRGTLSAVPTIISPFLVQSSKLRCENKPLPSKGSKVSLYVVHTGSESEITSAITTRTEKPPPSLQIYYEPLACFYQLAHGLMSPTSILVGQRYQSLSDKASSEELQVLYEIGECLASCTSLCFLREKVTWNPSKNSRDGEEPWRALYG